MSRILLHVLNILFLAAFALSAVVQFNDPDPWVWIVIYGLAALCCLLFLFRRLSRWTATGVGLIALIWAVVLLPAAVAGSGELSLRALVGSADMLNERVELAREIGGLMIVVFWMFVLALVLRRPR